MAPANPRRAQQTHRSLSQKDGWPGFVVASLARRSAARQADSGACHASHEAVGEQSRPRLPALRARSRPGPSALRRPPGSGWQPAVDAISARSQPAGRSSAARCRQVQRREGTSQNLLRPDSLSRQSLRLEARRLATSRMVARFHRGACPPENTRPCAICCQTSRKPRSS